MQHHIPTNKIVINPHTHNHNSVTISGNDLRGLEIASTSDISTPITTMSKYGIVITNVTTANRKSSTEQEIGQMVYDTDVDSLFIWNGLFWRQMSAKPDNMRIIPLFVENLAVIHEEIKDSMIKVIEKYIDYTNDFVTSGGGFASVGDKTIDEMISTVNIVQNELTPYNEILFKDFTDNDNNNSLTYTWPLVSPSNTENMEVYMFLFSGYVSVLPETISKIGWKNALVFPSASLDFSIVPLNAFTVGTSTSQDFKCTYTSNLHTPSSTANETITVDPIYTPQSAPLNSIEFNVKFIFQNQRLHVSFQLGNEEYSVLAEEYYEENFESTANFKNKFFPSTNTNMFWEIKTLATKASNSVNAPFVVTQNKFCAFTGLNLIWDNTSESLTYYDPFQTWRKIDFVT